MYAENLIFENNYNEDIINSLQNVVSEYNIEVKNNIR